MKRARASSLWTLRFAFAWTLGVPVVAGGLLLVPTSAYAQNEPLANELEIAHQCIIRGVYGESLDRLIDPFLGSKPEAYVWKALNLAGRAKVENNKALIGQAKSLLQKAGNAKGASEAAGLLENMPAPKWGTGKAEGNLVWALKNRALIGLAQQCAEGAIKNAGMSGNDLIEMKLTLADLLSERSRTPELEAEAAKRKAYFDQAKTLLGELAGGSAESLVMAKGTLYDIYYKRGSGLLEAAKRNGEQEDALKKEALEAFKEAVAFLGDETKKLDEERSKAAPPPAEPPKEGEEKKEAAAPATPPAEHCYKYAKYYWPKCLVGQAKCITDKAEHDKLVKQACDIYNDYNLEFGSDWENYGFEAAIDMCEAYLEIHDDENASISLESALAIEKQSEEYDPLHPPDPKKGLKLAKEQLEVFARASLKKGQLLKQKRDFKKAFAIYDKPFADATQSKNAEFEKSPIGLSLKIERAECMARDGKQKEAIKELEKMAADDPAGPVGQKANAMLARIRSGGGGGAATDDFAGFTPERAIQLMNETYDKGDYNTSSTYARLTLRLAKETGTEQKHSAKGYLGLGLCFEGQHRYYEAAVCFEEVVRRYKDSPEAGNAALEEVKCFQTLKSVLPNSYDKNAYDQALQFLTQNFPNVGKGVAPFLLGNSLKEEQKYEDAYKQGYDQVTADAGKLYDESLYLGGLCRYLVAKKAQAEKKDPKAIFAETESSLKKAIDTYAKDEPGMNDDRKAARKNLDAEARFLLSDVLLQDSINKPTEVIPLFENADKNYEGSPDRLSRAGLNRILAYLKLKQTEKAEDQLKVLLEKYKGTKRTILAAKDVAQALHRESAEKKDLSPEDRRKVRGRISEYYARWILDGLASTDARPNVKDMKDVANFLFQFALDIAGLPEDGGFVSEVEDTFDPGAAKQVFSDAHEILVELAKPDVQLGKSRSTVLALLGESSAFVHDWKNARVGFEGLAEDTKLMKEKNQLNEKVLQERKELLAYYFDLGKTYQQLGTEDKECFQKALDAFNNVVNMASQKSRYWWKAKFEFYKTQEKRGSEDDWKELGGELRALQRSYPDFKEAEKAGMQDKFKELVRALEAKGIKIN